MPVNSLCGKQDTHTHTTIRIWSHHTWMAISWATPKMDPEAWLTTKLRPIMGPRSGTTSQMRPRPPTRIPRAAQPRWSASSSTRRSWGREGRRMAVCASRLRRQQQQQPASTPHCGWRNSPRTPAPRWASTTPRLNPRSRTGGKVELLDQVSGTNWRWPQLDIGYRADVPHMLESVHSKGSVGSSTFYSQLV